MRILNLATFFVLLVLVFSGCSITIGGGGSPRQPQPVDRGSDTATLAEIDAASELTFDGDREKTFIKIASRPYLSGRAQGYLVKKAMQSLTFEDAKRNVLLALVDNAYFVAEGKLAVLDNLDALTFESSKQAVMDAINRRGHVPTEHELEKQLREQPQPAEPPQEEGAVQIKTTVEMQATYGTEF